MALLLIYGDRLFVQLILRISQGKLHGGQALAVKRLSNSSSQGFHELRNELVLAVKFKHRNLVQLLGVLLGGTREVGRVRIFA